MLAVALASARDTDEGSLWKFEAVRRASCFWAKEVPPPGVALGGGGDVELVESFEKRDWRFEREGDGSAVLFVGELA